jgi:hypothetical protein
MSVTLDFSTFWPRAPCIHSRSCCWYSLVCESQHDCIYQRFVRSVDSELSTKQMVRDLKTRWKILHGQLLIQGAISPYWVVCMWLAIVHRRQADSGVRKSEERKFHGTLQENVQASSAADSCFHWLELCVSHHCRQSSLKGAYDL